MSNTYQITTPNKKTIGVGVVNLGIPKTKYVPWKHNPSLPVRAGSQDALECPSMDQAGNLKPYWGLTK